MPRFDEVELEPVVFDVAPEASIDTEPAADTAAPRPKRLAALLIDLSLFAALALAVGALAGFVVVVSYYYYVGTWMLWGKTIGGAIFDVRVEKRTLRAAALRWLWMVAVVCVVAVVVVTARS